MKLHVSTLSKNVKIFTAILTFAILFSCDPEINWSGLDSIESANFPGSAYNSYFSPPEWIIGSWQGNKLDSTISPAYPIFEFTSDNFIGKDWQEQNNPPINFNLVISNSTFGFNVEELSTNNSYEIITRFPNIPTSYRFVKENDTTIVLHYNYNIELLDPEPPYKLYKVR